MSFHEFHGIPMQNPLEIHRSASLNPRPLTSSSSHVVMLRAWRAIYLMLDSHDGHWRKEKTGEEGGSTPTVMTVYEFIYCKCHFVSGLFLQIGMVCYGMTGKKWFLHLYVSQYSCPKKITGWWFGTVFSHILGRSSS